MKWTSKLIEDGSREHYLRDGRKLILTVYRISRPDSRGRFRWRVCMECLGDTLVTLRARTVEGAKLEACRLLGKMCGDEMRRLHGVRVSLLMSSSFGCWDGGESQVGAGR